MSGDTPAAAHGGGRLLEVDEIDKAYGATQALRSLSLRARSSEITGIVGANGAGKSTLVKILAGEVSEDRGTITLGGERLSVDRRRRSVAVVHQEPQLFPNLTVVENLLVDGSGLRRPRPLAPVLELLERLGLGRVARTELERTSIVVWQLTEIARALLRSAEVFLFDEPNSALTRDESRQLFEQMEKLRDAGKLVFLVSHRLSEVAELCGEVLVIRDGALIATLAGTQASAETLASLLTADEAAPAILRPGQPVCPPAAPVSTPPSPRSPDSATSSVATFEALPGRVLAVTGPEGGGGRELTRAVRLRGLDGATTAATRSYMPSDRRQSLFYNLSVAANIASRLDSSSLGRFGLLNARSLEQSAAAYIERFSIKAEHAGASVGSLSGGNQQKVALAAALAVSPALLVVEEPTRGVDLRTKLQIYSILRDFAASGGAVVVFVTELEDAAGCADLLYIVAEGAMRGVVEVAPGADIEQLAIAVNGVLSRSDDAA